MASATATRTPRRETLKIEGARLIWRNFEGKAGPYNDPGDRSFHVVIPPENVEALREVGWNVRTKPPREEGDEPLNTLEVKVSYRPGSRPPRCVLVTSRGQTTLDEDTIKEFDIAEIENVDLIINPYHWEVQGKSGIKAYLKSIYVTVVEDELELKYGSAFEPDEERGDEGVRFD